MRIIASLVCMSALVAPTFGKWGWTNFWNKWRNEDAEWTCHYSDGVRTKEKGPFKYQQAMEFIQEKLEKLKYTPDNIKISNEWLEVPYEMLLDTETMYELEHPVQGGEQALYCLSGLLRGALADAPGQPINDKCVRERDFDGNFRGKSGKTFMKISKLLNPDSAGGAAGAPLNVLLQQTMDFKTYKFPIVGRIGNMGEAMKLNNFVLEKAIEIIGETLITRDETTAKYFFHGGDSINKFDTNRPVWTEACYEKSNHPRKLSWPGLYGHTRFFEGRADVCMFEFDQERFTAAGGEIIEMTESLLTNIIPFEEQVKLIGGKGPIESLLVMKPKEMGLKVWNYMNGRGRPKQRKYWVNRPIVIKRNRGTIDCHIFVNGAARFLRKRLQVDLTHPTN